MSCKVNLIIAVFCLFLVSCSGLPTEMMVAEQVLETHPDSALHLLQQVTPDQLKSDRARAFYGLLFFEALNKNNLPLGPDSLINLAICYFEQKDDKVHLATSYFYKGRMYMYACRYEEATAFYLKALDNSNGRIDYALLGKLYGDMGYICTVQQEFVKAREKFKLAVDCYRHSGKMNDVAYSLLYIGRTYHCVKEYDMALHYYRQSLKYAHDSMVLGVVYQELGINYYLAKQVDSATYYLRKSIKYPYCNTNYAIRCSALADIYLDSELCDSAYHYAFIALNYPSNCFIQRDCYRILANLESLKGNKKQLEKYMACYQSYTDSVRKIDLQTKPTVLEDLHNSTLQAKKAKQDHDCLFCLIVLIIVISCECIIYLYLRNKKEKREIHELHLHEKGSIQINNIFKQRDILVQKIETQKAEQAAKRKKGTSTEKEELDKKVYDDLLHFSNSDLFFCEMNIVFNKLVCKLQIRYPAITLKEMSWCCLLLLNVPLADIYLLLNYKPDSLTKMKQRLAQKTKLANASELTDFLHRILSEE